VKKTWLLAGTVVVVVVIAVVAVLVVVLTSGPDTGTAEGVAEAAVDAFADKDDEALTEFLCADAANPLEQVAPAPLVGAELGEVRQVDADNAVAEVSVTYADSTEQTDMGLTRENGAWCVARFGG
jgi:hypothetical protein